MRLGFVTLLFVVGSRNVQGSAEAEEALKQAYEEFWEWRLQNNPEFASNIGDHRYDAQLEDYRYATIGERQMKLEQLKTTVDDLVTITLSPISRTTYDVLKDMIQTWLDGYKWKDYAPMNPISFLDGIQTKYTSRAGIIKFLKEKDFENFITRIRGYADRVDDVIFRMQRAIYLGTTHHAISMAKVPGQLEKITRYKNNETYFAFYEPFDETLDGVVGNVATRDTIRQNATAAIGYFIGQAEILKKFIEDYYMPNTRSLPGVLVLPDGKDYYKACLKWHLSMDADPEKIHEDGKKEVERVFEKMTQIVRGQGHQGKVKDYFDSLRTRTEFFIQDGEELLQRMRDILSSRIRPAIREYFNDTPDFPMEIKGLTYDGPIGIYKNGAADGSRPGVFYANVVHPERNPTYGLPALLMHETDPGHHLQDAYALTSDEVPDFMKSTDFSKYFAAPLHFPFFTAYSEGWALYCEDLGEELGIYKDDFEKLGKLNLEIFRAARMVVDTGLHYYGWSKEEAVEYMFGYSTSSRSAIESEIDRYATWPGQATSYTVGKLKIQALRREAEAALGRCFDIKQFHKTLLVYGAMPLSVLEDVVLRWIGETNWANRNNNCRDEDPSRSAALQSNLWTMVLIPLLLTLRA